MMKFNNLKLFCLTHLRLGVRDSVSVHHMPHASTAHTQSLPLWTVLCFQSFSNQFPAHGNKIVPQHEERIRPSVCHIRILILRFYIWGISLCNLIETYKLQGATTSKFCVLAWATLKTETETSSEIVLLICQQHGIKSSLPWHLYTSPWEPQILHQFYSLLSHKCFKSKFIQSLSSIIYPA
jgi:hypothetical protein